MSDDGAKRIFDGRRDRYGRSYGELEPGDVYRHWPGKTVTEADDHLFCLLTMATSPLHIDAAFAAREMAEAQNIVVDSKRIAVLRTKAASAIFPRQRAEDCAGRL